MSERQDMGASAGAETGSREPSPDGLGPSGFDPARFAEPGFNEFGKVSLDAAGEALGLPHGLRAERARRGWRCTSCGRMQRVGSWLVWVSDGLQKDDPLWAFEEAAIFRGSWHGSGWCLSCVPKRAAKATPTRSAKTTKIGLVRRMVARCRKAFAQPPPPSPPSSK